MVRVDALLPSPSRRPLAIGLAHQRIAHQVGRPGLSIRRGAVAGEATALRGAGGVGARALTQSTASGFRACEKDGLERSGAGRVTVRTCDGAARQRNATTSTRCSHRSPQAGCCGGAVLFGLLSCPVTSHGARTKCGCVLVAGITSSELLPPSLSLPPLLRGSCRHSPAAESPLVAVSTARGGGGRTARLSWGQRG